MPDTLQRLCNLLRGHLWSSGGAIIRCPSARQHGYLAVVVDARRAQVFGSVADAYDVARPTYPAEVVDLIVADGPASALDVGCGTGKAARLVMARGVDVLGIEPDERMAAIARSHGVPVIRARFEDWVGARRDCVFSAQAWHWIDPARGAVQAAAVLPPGGRWIAIWNREDDDVLTDVLDELYSQLAPHLLEEQRDAMDREPDMVAEVAACFAATGAFGPLERHDVRWTDEITVAHLSARLSTHSGHRLLPPSVADELHDSLVTALGGPDRVVTVTYDTMALTTQRG
jgi:SAM-dependent methyltransferase